MAPHPEPGLTLQRAGLVWCSAAAAQSRGWGLPSPALRALGLWLLAVLSAQLGSAQASRLLRHSFPLVLACVRSWLRQCLAVDPVGHSSVLSVPWGQEEGVRAGEVARCHLIQMPRPSLSCAAPAAQGVLGTSRGEGKTGPLRHFPLGQGGVGVTNSGVLSSENCRMQRASMHPGLWTPRDHVGELGGWPSGPSGACAMRAEPGPQAIPGAGELSASVEPGERGYW